MENKIVELEKQIIISKNDRKRIFRRAHYLVREMFCFSLSQALKQCWKELKEYNFKLECELINEINKIKSLYRLELPINEQLNRAFLRGENVYCDGY